MGNGIGKKENAIILESNLDCTTEIENIFSENKILDKKDQEEDVNIHEIIPVSASCKENSLEENVPLEEFVHMEESASIDGVKNIDLLKVNEEIGSLVSDETQCFEQTKKNIEIGSLVSNEFNYFEQRKENVEYGFQISDKSQNFEQPKENVEKSVNFLANGEIHLPWHDLKPELPRSGEKITLNQEIQKNTEYNMEKKQSFYNIISEEHVNDDDDYYGEDIEEGGVYNEEAIDGDDANNEEDMDGGFNKERIDGDDNHAYTGGLEAEEDEPDLQFSGFCNIFNKIADQLRIKSDNIQQTTIPEMDFETEDPMYTNSTEMDEIPAEGNEGEVESFTGTPGIYIFFVSRWGEQKT